MRVVLLNNPSSGSGSGPSGDELAAMLRQEGAADVATVPIDAAAEALAPGVDRVVLSSGDGGVGPAAEAAGAAGVPLAVIPSGTANDFARRMRLPDDPRQAARLAVRGEHRRRLDLARMGDRPFANVATAGLAVAATRRASPLKRVLGPLAYLAGAAATGVMGRPLGCAVDVDGRRVFQGRAWQVMVACSGAFGAGSVIDEAEPDDGLLDVVVIQAGNRLRLIQYATALREGRITGQPGVLGARGARVSLGLPDGAQMNVDGDVIPAQTPIVIAPRHFELVVP
ncbi:MAG TPA: diacylglycerol kinase family protein [Miltoncostaeaceae bacterium]|nr:diacylglycerol kinase family protein [Miltoncostaeaceae bacterium]